MNDKERFRQLRKRLFGMIKKELEEDPCCKSYEGCLEVTAEYPNYFEDEEATGLPCYYQITLHCYVIGNARHYDFHGDTFDNCLDQLERFLDGCEGIERD